MRILIIGGGLIGLTSALQLKLNGADEVTLVDRKKVGFESSYAAAGMLAPQAEADSAGDLFALTSNARDYYPEFVAELERATDIDIGFETSGTYFASFSDEELELLKNRFRWQASDGFEVELLNAQELHKEEPFVSPDTVGGLYFPRDWQIENRKLIGAVLKHCELSGVEIVEDTEITRIENSKSLIAVSEDGQTFEADKVLVCAGAWTRQLRINGNAVAEFETKPIRGQMISFRTAKQLLKHVIYSHRGYLVPRKNGLILVGSTTEEVGFDDRVTDEGVDKLKSIATELVPTLVDLRIEESWSGLRPKGPTEKPIMGKLIEFDNIYVSTGHYRNGILLAPYCSSLISNLLLEGYESEILRAFRPGERFAPATT